MPRQPIACSALLARAIPSAPSASAFTKSDATRRPPVMVRVTSRRPILSRCRRTPLVSEQGTRFPAEELIQPELRVPCRVLISVALAVGFDLDFELATRTAAGFPLGLDLQQSLQGAALVRCQRRALLADRVNGNALASVR